jgi:hypothetical protein
MSGTGATDPMIKPVAHVWLTPKESLCDFFLDSVWVKLWMLKLKARTKRDPAEVNQ